jgi:hypothetical protein
LSPLHQRVRLRSSSAAAAAVLLVWFGCAAATPPSRAAESLPSELIDTEFWRILSDFSEPHQYFYQNVVTSNEVSYQYVLPRLMTTARSGGAYFGVGPEQNFTYIAALQPHVAFIFDIRRDMLLEHLMYKGVFEMSPDRVAFVSNLFSRKPPPSLRADSPVLTIFEEFANVPADQTLAEANLEDLLTRLKTRHRFPLAADDERGIRAMYLTFAREGVVNFLSSFLSPGYARLMTATDGAGKNWSYLATAENYDRVRALQVRNLIVPLVGDFTGRKAIRMAGEYLKDHGATLNAFYISNVEDYIRPGWPQYVDNIASLPVDDSSVFIRWRIGSVPTLASIPDFVRSERPSR